MWDNPITELLIDILQELGDVSEELKKTIVSQRDMSVLSKWVKQVIKFDTAEAFEAYISK